MTRKYVVKDIGQFTAANQVIDFAYKLPNYCKRLTGIQLFSPELCNSASTNIDVQVSVSINNQKKFLGNDLLSLGYNDLDDHQSRMIKFNDDLIPTQEVSGWVKCITYSSAFNVHLVFETLAEE